jgi:hypothetical protein
MRSTPRQLRAARTKDRTARSSGRRGSATEGVGPWDRLRCTRLDVAWRRYGTTCAPPEASLDIIAEPLEALQLRGLSDDARGSTGREQGALVGIQGFAAACLWASHHCHGADAAARRLSRRSQEVHHRRRAAQWRATDATDGVWLLQEHDSGRPQCAGSASAHACAEVTMARG